MQRLWSAALAAFATLAVGHASAAEQRLGRVVVAVGGVTSQTDKLTYAVALHRGYFKEEGLDVESIDFNAGSKALEALVGGSADVAQGGFSHVGELQSKGVNLISIAPHSRYPGFVLVVAKDRANAIRTPADLKDKTIGVSAPGGSTQTFVALVMQKAHLPLTAARFVSIGDGASAVAALRSGALDAVSNNDPNITVMTSEAGAVVFADSRTEEGTRMYYGGDMVEATIYCKQDWLASHHAQAQALANGIAHAQQWMQTATPEQITDSMPEDYYSSNKARYEAVVKANLPGFIWDGLVSPEAARNAFNSVTALEPELRNEKIDLSRTYTNEFMIEARKKYPMH